jgi:hypothetical protein
MAKVQHRRANKAYPENGIEKGDMYYFAQIKTGPYSSRTIRQKHPISQSQLTTSEYLQSLYALQETARCFTHITDFLDVPDQLRELADAARERLASMPESLQQSDAGQLLETRADSCESVADEIESLTSDWDEDALREEYAEEPADSDDTTTLDDDVQTKIDDACSELVDQAMELLGSVET